MEKLKNGFTYFVSTLKEYANRCSSFFSGSMGELKKIFIKLPVYSILSLYVVSICLSSFAFYDNTFLSIYADSIFASQHIIDEKFSNITFQSYASEIDASELSRLNSIVYSMNQYTYQNAFTFLAVSSNDYNTPAFGKITSLSTLDDSYKIACDFDSGAATFSNYNRESLKSVYFSGTHIEKVFSTMETLQWNNFNYENKSASSFVSTDFADYVINLSNDDELNTYEDLIGMKITYEIGNGQTYSFSINNMYKSSTYFGPSVVKTLGTPIITDCTSLFTNNSVSIYSSCIKSALDLRELIYQLGLQTNQGYDFMCFFVDQNGNRIFDNRLDFIPIDIVSVGKDNYSMLQGTNTVGVIFFLIALIASLILSFIFALRSNINAKFVFLYSIVLSLCFAIVDGIIFLILGNTIKTYKILNPVVGIVGTILPLFIAGAFFLAQLIQKKRRNEND